MNTSADSRPEWLPVELSIKEGEFMESLRTNKLTQVSKEGLCSTAMACRYAVENELEWRSVCLLDQDWCTVLTRPAA